jgi:ElaB/YqjD/DUF883 family membrane-anchored ribosome-binding protein
VPELISVVTVWSSGRKFKMATVRRKTLRTLQEDLDVLSAEVSDLAAAPADGPSLALDEVRKRIRRVRADFQKLAADISSKSPAATTVAMADKIIDPVEDSLSQRPMATVAIGFGLGFILGLLWRRG